VYPTFSDLVNDLLGTSICLPVQTFGFFVAMAFVAAYWLFHKELVRKSTSGILPSQSQRVQTGGPIDAQEIGYAALLWGLLGYKLGPVFTDNSIFCNHPQDAILSLHGDYRIALLAAGISGFLKYREYAKNKHSKPEYAQIQTGAEASLGNVTMIAAIGGIVGAKVFHNLENPVEFMRDPVGALTSFDGLTFYGGLIVATLGISYYLRKLKIPLLPYFDAGAPALMLAYGIGRMGCQFSGDGDWGIVNTLPKPSWLSWAPDWAWAYTYPNNVIREGVPIPGCVGDFCYQLPEAVFPTPLYEIFMAFILAGLLWGLRKRLVQPGKLFAIYLIVNGMERFLIEKIRVNTTIEFIGMHITQAEIISFCMILGGIIMFTYLHKKAEKAVHP
jgi:phosphatidylglycerol---prolipoprotein diacylglyceryl transferase